MSHTPGPWFATFEDYRWVIECQGEFGPKKALAVTAGSYPKHEANAHLIAAAPAMLEALEALANEYGPHTGRMAVNAPRRAMWFNARAAIRAAKGEA